MKSKGFWTWTRPETLEPSSLAKMKEHHQRMLDNGRPYVSYGTSNLLKIFAPRPSTYFDRDPARAAEKVEARSKAFEGAIHFLRHLTTWGMSHVAIGAFHLHNFWTFHMHITEVIDCYGFPIGQNYALARLNIIQQSVDLTLSAPRPAQPSGQPPSASTTVGLLLIHEDYALLQHLLLNHRRDTRTSASVKPHGADSPSKGQQASRRATQVCFLHDAAGKKSCPDQKRRGRLHLDTSKPSEKERFDKAKSAHDARVAGKD
jgi:hypothetical protein